MTEVIIRFEGSGKEDFTALLREAAKELAGTHGVTIKEVLELKRERWSGTDWEQVNEEELYIPASNNELARGPIEDPEDF